MDDIVERLRHMAWVANEGEPYADALRSAADEIDRLRDAGDALAEFIRVRLPILDGWHDETGSYLRMWKEAHKEANSR